MMNNIFSEFNPVIYINNSSKVTSNTQKQIEEKAGVYNNLKSKIAFFAPPILSLGSSIGLSSSVCKNMEDTFFSEKKELSKQLSDSFRENQISNDILDAINAAETQLKDFVSQIDAIKIIIDQSSSTSEKAQCQCVLNSLISDKENLENLLEKANLKHRELYNKMVEAPLEAYKNSCVKKISKTRNQILITGMAIGLLVGVLAKKIVDKKLGIDKNANK